MNAAQRRIATRTTARAFPLGRTVTTERGIAATITGHAPAAVRVMYRNGRAGALRTRSLTLA